VHHHRVVLDAVPAGATRALDAGCGEGRLARDLRAVVPHVVAIDRDAPTVERARRERDRDRDDDVSFVVGDVLGHPFRQASFDLVASIATLHHVDAERGLERLRDLVRPGGVLVVVGLARSQYPRDAAHDVAGVVATRLHRVTKTHREVDAPTVWPPPLSYADMAAVAERVLPGVRYRRHVLFRYSLTWTRRK
jgi:SAM-dependent methyltransferase